MAEELSRWKRFKRYLKRNCTKTWAKHVSYQIFALFISIMMVAGVANYAVTKSYDERTLLLGDDFTVTSYQGAFGSKESQDDFVSLSINNNVDVIEIVVRQRPSGELVMSHELVVTNADGVPLSGVLNQIKSSDCGIDFNIKDMRCLNPLYDLIVENELLERSFLTGIQEYDVDTVKKSNCSKMDYYLELQPSRLKIFGTEYAEDIIERVEKSGAIGINCNYRYAGGKLAEYLHKNGYKLSVDSVNKKYNMKRILVAQPDNVITKEYDELKLLINNWGE